MTPATIQCPFCREMSDVRYLKHDFRVQTLVEIYKSQQKLANQIHVELNETSCCQLCRSKAFIGKCLDCDKFLCDSCQATHNSIPTCELHNVVSVHDMILNCKAKVHEIHDNLMFDKNTLISQLDRLSDHLSTVEQQKRDILLILEQSEEAMIERIKRHYEALREQLENSVSESKAQVAQGKVQVCDVITQVMSRSQKLVDTLSGADINTVLSKIDDVESETECLAKAAQLSIPQLKLDVVHSLKIEDFGLSQFVDMQVKAVTSSNQLAGVVHHNNCEANTAIFVDKSESSAIRYKFDYCDQVCVMLAKLQENLEASLNTPACDRLESASHCMVSPSKLSAAVQRANSNCDDIISRAVDTAVTAYGEVLLAKCEEPQSLRLVADEIWCSYREYINVYDFDLTFRQVVKLSKFAGRLENFVNLKAVAQAYTGHYFTACETSGLQILAPDRMLIRVLHTGHVCDVISDQETVYALETKASEVLVFKYYGTESLHWRKSPWKLEYSFKSACALSNDDTMAVVNETIVICSYRNSALHRYSLSGEPLASLPSSPSKRSPGHLWRPRICCRTGNGSLLIADHYNNRLQVLTPDGQWQVLQFARALSYPWDAVLANECGLVVLERCNWKHKLIQFVNPDPAAAPATRD